MTRALHEKVSELAGDLGVPGVAVGILTAGETLVATHGVTSVENPLPVDVDTLFQFGSTGKTFTATAMLRLVERGDVDLDAPVRAYLPDFRVVDEDVSRSVTVLHLLNHTAGWSGDIMDDTGAGDDALAQYVERMATAAQQVSPLGSAVSYNNASLSVAGRIIEAVTGTTYEQAIADLLLGPLGMEQTFFFLNDIITRRFVVGHRRHDDGHVTVERPWALPRGGNPAGGMSATIGDQLAWARFHLGDGSAPDGTRVLSEAMLTRMRQPTAEMRGSALGDAVGISWLLSTVGGVELVSHGGTTIGQYSSFVMAPARDFAFVSMTNCGPNGSQFNHQMEQWAVAHYLGVTPTEPTPLVLTDTELEPYVGRYETVAAVCDITAEAGRLVARVSLKEEAAAALGARDEDQPPVILGLLAPGGDEYVVAEGAAQGMKGFFARGADGQVTGVHLGGRLATKTVPQPA